MYGANLFYDVRKIAEYFAAEDPPPQTNPPRCIEEWCEEGDPLIDLSIDDRVPLESDLAESINLISGIQQFLEQHCHASRFNFSLLETRPLNYKTCKLALWHVKQFYAFFRIDDQQDLSLQRYSSKYGLDPSVQYLIQKQYLKALLRYTKRLKLDEKMAASVQWPILENQKLINSGSPNFKIQYSTGKIPMTKEKKCFDECVLF